MTLRQEYQRLINKHFAAVQTDTALGHKDSWSHSWALEKKSKQFWEEFRALEAEFVAKLEAQS